MKVVKFKTSQGKERYYVANDLGIPIESILKFIKFKDNANYARNTLKQYCYHLKIYFEYLEQKDKDFKKINIDDLSMFVNWLQNSNINKKVISIKDISKNRCEKSINYIIDTVLIFYDYLLRHEEYSNDISERLKKILCDNPNNFKGFLYGIAYQKKKISTNILKLRVPLKSLKTLNKEQIQILLNACNNYRDKFLITLLYETGIRIGELLSLWLEDFDISNKFIDIKDRGQLENNSEIKTVSSPRTVDVSQNIIDMFMKYVELYHTDIVSTNHIFIKISGKNKYKAMNYIDVDNLFRNLRRKTNIYVTPHIFRHTSISTLRKAGWEPELLRIRAGHKNIYTTLNTYVHITNEEITEAFSKVKETVVLGGEKYE